MIYVNEHVLFFNSKFRLHHPWLSSCKDLSYLAILYGVHADSPVIYERGYFWPRISGWKTHRAGSRFGLPLTDINH